MCGVFHILEQVREQYTRARAIRIHKQSSHNIRGERERERRIISRFENVDKWNIHFNSLLESTQMTLPTASEKSRKSKGRPACLPSVHRFHILLSVNPMNTPCTSSNLPMNPFFSALFSNFSSQQHQQHQQQQQQQQQLLTQLLLSGVLTLRSASILIPFLPGRSSQFSSAILYDQSPRQRIAIPAHQQCLGVTTAEFS